MNAADRVGEYTKLKTEDNADTRAPAPWPPKGRVEVEKK